MKTLGIILIALMLSCSPEESDCNCTRYVYETQFYYDWSTGLPHLMQYDEFQYEEGVVCQDEVTTLTQIGTTILKYTIFCE